MSQAPFWPVATDAFIADTVHLSAEETGAYLMLLMCLWRNNGKPLKLDHKKLSRMARVRPNRWPIIWQNIRDFFDVNECTVTQKRLRKDWVTVQEKVTRNRELGSLGGKAKSLKTKKPPLANATVSLDDNCSERGSNHNHNHNHKDIKELSKDSTKSSNRKDKSSAKRAKRIEAEFGDDWQLPEKYHAFARRNNLRGDKINSEVRKFFEYWTSPDARLPAKKDWFRTWKDWINNSVEWSSRKNGGGDGPSRYGPTSVTDITAEIISERDDL